jgi:putative ABC transport system substrate-binding protein
VDLIVTSSTTESQAAKAATQSIPIVMAAGADPVRTGLVASLARPGGTITGMTGIATELEGKRLELLRAILPRLSRVAYLAYGSDPAHRLFVKETQDAAAHLGIQVQPLVLGSVEEIDGAFAALRSEHAEALMVQPLFMTQLGQGQRIADLAVQHRLPTVSHARQLPQVGGLMSYTPDVPAMARRAAVFVDKILKGVRPGDLPVEQPTKFRLVINLKTAKALGLDVPPLLLATADEVIE